MSEASMKSPRGRPASTIKKDDWHVKIEQEVSLFWRMHFHDEFTRTTKKGELSDLCNRLLKEEMNRIKGAPHAAG